VRDLLGVQIEKLEFNVEAARDKVLVAPLKTGGGHIISPKRRNVSAYFKHIGRISTEVEGLRNKIAIE